MRDRGAVQYGGLEDQPLPGDYDGDGRTDIAVYRPATGRWFVLQETSASFFKRLLEVVTRR